MTERTWFKTITSLLGNIKPLTGHIMLAAALGIMANLLTSFITILGAFAVLRILGYETPLQLDQITMILLAFVFIRALLSYGEQIRNQYIALRTLAIIRDKVFKSLRRLCPAKLERNNRKTVIDQIVSDVSELEMFYARTVSPIVISTVFTIIMTLFISYFHILLGVIALATFLMMGIVVPTVISNFTVKQETAKRDRFNDLSDYLRDSLRGIREVQQYEQGESILSEIGRRSSSMSHVDKELKDLTGKNAAFAVSIVMISETVMIFTGITLFNNGEITFPALLIPVLALISSLGPAVALAEMSATIRGTLDAGNRILDLLEEESESPEVTEKSEIPFNGMDIERIHFSYNGSETISDLSMHISKGEMIGLTGNEGSGKSTLLKLMMRFWKVGSGNIKFGDRHIDFVNTDNLRRMEGFVDRDTHLFHDTVRNNLLIAKLDATEDEIVSACKKAYIHDFIVSLPNGYDTVIGGPETVLSQGEKQRIGLARALLHDAPLLIMDDPTSDLDSMNESMFLRTVDGIREGKTVVMASPRESPLRTADRILTMKDGSMEE